MTCLTQRISDDERTAFGEVVVSYAGLFNYDLRPNSGIPVAYLLYITSKFTEQSLC
jgi:hypothetical protein